MCSSDLVSVPDAVSSEVLKQAVRVEPQAIQGEMARTVDTVSDLPPEGDVIAAGELSPTQTSTVTPDSLESTFTTNEFKSRSPDEPLRAQAQTSIDNVSWTTPAWNPTKTPTTAPVVPSEGVWLLAEAGPAVAGADRKSTRLNSSH